MAHPVFAGTSYSIIRHVYRRIQPNHQLQPMLSNLYDLHLKQDCPDWQSTEDQPIAENSRSGCTISSGFQVRRVVHPGRLHRFAVLVVLGCGGS